MQGALSNGFEENGTTFINWEQVTKKNNKSITDNERKNLYEQIAVAHRKDLNFIIIIDEEHSHNTSKADEIIQAFASILKSEFLLLQKNKNLHGMKLMKRSYS